MITRIVYSVLLSLGCLAPFLSHAQEALSLAQAIETGLRNNYQIQIAEREASIAALNNDWTVAGRYPTINLSLNVNNSFTSNNNPASFLREFNSLNSGVVPGVEATWVLFDGHKVRLNKEQLERLQQLGQGNAQIAVENGIQMVIMSYYSALVENERLEVRRKVLNLSRDRLDYEKTRRDYGQASTFDVLQTQDAYINDSTSYLLQLTNYENALRSLNLSMGVDDLSKKYTLTDKLAYTAPDYELGVLKSRMLLTNRTLSNLSISRELASVQTKLAESENDPSLSLRTGATYTLSRNHIATGVTSSGEERDFGGVRNTAFNGFVNFTLAYPLYDWGLRKRNIQSAQLNETIVQLNIEDLKRTLSAQLENTLAQYNSQKQLVEVTGQLVANAQRNLEIAEERFRGGLINAFDYRTIQLGYINATQSQLNTFFNLKTTETELVRLIGGLVR